MTTLSDKGTTLLGDLPSYYANDRIALAAIDCIGRELLRIEDFILAMREQAVPGKADDTYGLLSLWEAVLDVPVAPVGASVAVRQSIAAAAYRKRSTAAGYDWVGAVNTLLGTAWSYTENSPSDYTVKVTVADDTGYKGGQVQALLRAITPAHLVVTPQTGIGFKVDEDQVDIDTI